MKKIGIVDTMFSRYDMGKSAIDELRGLGTGYTVERVTVPGIKDLPVAALNLIQQKNCDIVMALGMPGRERLDKMSAIVASMGIMQVQLSTGVHVLEVFVHEEEAESDRELAMLMERRARGHARNAFMMLFHPEQLTERAGKGVRQGYEDVGPIDTGGGGIRH